MRKGYVRLYRKSLDSGLIRNHNAWILFTYCLLKATHKKRKAVIGKQEIMLFPGQFIFGRRMAAEETGLTEQQIRTALGTLKTLQILTIKPTNKFSIITIINWGSYQAPESEVNQQSNQHLTSNQPQTKTEECKNNLSVDLYQFYLKEITPKEKSRQRALSNISSHLKKYSTDDLRQVILNYKTVAASRDPQYRKNPANFFGKQEPAFIDYLPGNFQAEADTDEKDQVPPVFSANNPEAMKDLYKNE